MDRSTSQAVLKSQEQSPFDDDADIALIAASVGAESTGVSITDDDGDIADVIQEVPAEVEDRGTFNDMIEALRKSGTGESKLAAASAFIHAHAGLSMTPDEAVDALVANGTWSEVTAEKARAFLGE